MSMESLNFKHLMSKAIIKQLEELRNRVAERFPDPRPDQDRHPISADISRPTAREAHRFSDKIWWMRILVRFRFRRRRLRLLPAVQLLRTVDSAAIWRSPNLRRGWTPRCNIFLLSGLFILFFLGWRAASSGSRR